jgi:hypothetical protein
MNTATNRGSRWLFPGRRAGQPMHPEALSATVRHLGIPNAAARTAALRQLVLEMPAPVVADALGYHYTTTTRIAAQAGGVWTRYATRPEQDRHRAGNRTHPATVEYATSPVRNPVVPHPMPSTLTSVGEREPLILVSLSSTNFRGEQRVLDALRGVPARTVVTTGTSVDPAAMTAGPGTENPRPPRSRADPAER